MGKRKSSAKPQKKVVQRLNTTFNCLFCNHEGSITCVLDKKNSIGSLSCKVCGQSFQTKINTLSQPVDVYSDWYDAVEEVNRDGGSDASDASSDEEVEEPDSEDDLGRNRGVARIVDEEDSE